MTALVIALILVPIIAVVLVALNYALAPHRPVFTKKGTYECGLLARSSQSRQPFSVLFYVVACLFMVLDLEVLLCYPLVTVLTLVGPYGFWVFIIFAAILTAGFAVELASGALAFTKA